MCALAPLNLLVILNTHVPEALGEAQALSEGDSKRKYQSPTDLNGLDNVENDGLGNEHPANENATPSVELLRSLKQGCPFGGNDAVELDGFPSYASVGGLGIAARRPAQLPWSNSEDNRAVAGAILVAMGIAAFGHSPPASSSSNRGISTVILGTMGSAAYGTDAAPLSTGEDVEKVDGSVNMNNRKIEASAGSLQLADASLDSSASTSPETEKLVIGANDASTCQCSCPGAVVVPQHIFEQAALLHEADVKEKGKSKAHITLVMSHENMLALTVITILSIFGAIYLWKICTRQRCSCRLCRFQYRCGDLLGSGGYGSVYLVDRVTDGEQFVAKKILVRDITEVDEYSLEAKELITLRHKHIVSYEDDFVHVEYGTFEPKTYFVIIMEFCPEGDLKGKIELDFPNFTEDYVRSVFAQVLEAVQYLHSKNVIHRDLKSQNVFLTNDGQVRLGDFGLCKHTRGHDGIGSASLTHAGTDCYMAPEMLSSSKYGKPADMWSLGCVLCELVTGVFMWELDGILGAMVMKDSQAVVKLLKAKMVPCVGNTITSLLKRLLSIRPEARPTITTCLRKKLFKPNFPLSREPFGQFLDPEGSQEQSESSPSRELAGAEDSNTFSGEEESDAAKSEEDDAPTPTTKKKRRQRKRNAGRRGPR